MNKIIKSIPNTLTCISLFFGCLSILYSIEGNFLYAVACILIGSIFDFSDGFAARALKASSAIGKELDSLADQVSFGVAPGFGIYFWMKGHVDCSFCEYLPYIAFLIPAFLMIFAQLSIKRGSPILYEPSVGSPPPRMYKFPFSTPFVSSPSYSM